MKNAFLLKEFGVLFLLNRGAPRVYKLSCYGWSDLESLNGSELVNKISSLLWWSWVDHGIAVTKFFLTVEIQPS